MHLQLNRYQKFRIQNAIQQRTYEQKVMGKCNILWIKSDASIRGTDRVIKKQAIGRASP
jgi:hypothetical protein